MEIIMPWIENVAAADIPTGFHHDCGINSMLISICDPLGWRPEAKHQFKERHDFEFLDAEDNDGFPEEAKISDAQAEKIVELLQHALENRMNVVVHCTAGICRSGAVAEVGVMMGFNDAEKFRIPNIRVKHKLMKVLGWTYDADEKPAPLDPPIKSGWDI
jgi:rhodanese-related sulfurtransferase